MDFNNRLYQLRKQKGFSQEELDSYLWPKVVMTDNSAQTMPMLIANMSSGYTTDYGMLMMGVLFCSVPTMVVFFVLQKQFAEGITGAVK